MIKRLALPTWCNPRDKQNGANCIQDGDEGGRVVSPLFERNAFGNKNREWDD
jgi:hypothetical protein